MSLVALSLVASVMAGTGYADDLIVTGNQTVTGMIDGNVIVLETGNARLSNVVVNGDVICLGGQVRCGTLLGGTVELITGDVLIEAGGRFSTGPIRNANITIEGNVKADSALNIVVRLATVFGNVKITNSGNNGASVFSGITIQGSNVGGNVKVEDNSALLLSVNLNTVLGDVKVDNNWTYLDSITVMNNDIGGNLRCVGNAGSPTISGNVVAGDIKVDN